MAEGAQEEAPAGAREAEDEGQPEALGLLERITEAALRLRHEAQVFEQRRINRLRAGGFAVEREQIVAPLALRDLNAIDAEFEICDTERNQLFVSDGIDLVAKHVAHDQGPGNETFDQPPCLHADEPEPLEALESQEDQEGQESPKGARTRRPLYPSQTTHKLRWILEHRYFTYAVSVVVLLNAIFIFLDEEQQSSANMGRPWSQAWKTFLVITDIAFDTLFCVEVGIRIAVEQLAFFCQPWNLLDFALVAVALVGKAFGLLLGSEHASSRWFRVFRLGRLLWLLHLFESLWIIIVGVASAMRTIVWAFILLFIIIYVFGILSARMIGQSLDDPTMEPEDAEQLRVWFVGIPESMFTLLTMMTMEGWAEIVRVVAKYHSGWCFVFFFLFFSLTTWGLMNMVVAVIIDATVGKALHHLENYVKVTAAERHEAIKKICACFFLTGVNASAKLTREQFLHALEDKEFVSKLHDVGIDARQAHTLFDLLDFDRSGTLSMNEFTEGVLEARGKGHAMDVLRLKYDLQRHHAATQAGAAALRGGLEGKTAELLREARALRSGLQEAARGCRGRAGA